MDKRCNKRVALIAGLLFLILVGNIFAVGSWIKAVEVREHERLGQYILLKPESEEAYLDLFTERSGEDKSVAVAAGEELLERYGYTDQYYFFSRSVLEILPVILFSSAFILLLSGGFIFYWHRKGKEEKNRIFELEDKIVQLQGEKELLRDRAEREEIETKSLVTDISHQLKTPLASLKMCYEIADTSSFTTEERDSFLKQGLQEIIRLENLTKSLIQLSRLETNMIQIKPERTSLKEILYGAVNRVYMKAFDKNISISADEFEDEQVFLDLKWTQEALLNVLDNAVKYSESGTFVEIRLIPMVSYFLMEIEDQGIGIPKEEMNQIFKRFYRGKAQEIQKNEGSGVGLYLSRKILEDQGCSIRVKRGKKGSIFQVTIPRIG